MMENRNDPKQGQETMNQIVKGRVRDIEADDPILFDLTSLKEFEE